MMVSSVITYPPLAADMVVTTVGSGVGEGSGVGDGVEVGEGIGVAVAVGVGVTAEPLFLKFAAVTALLLIDK